MERSLWQPQFNRSRPGAFAPRLWWLLAAILLAGSASSRAASLTASVDRDTITLGETFTLSLRFEDVSPSAPELPSIPGLQIDYVGPSSQFSFINGRTTSSVTHNYIITPRQAGDFTIPGITTTINGQTLTTTPIKLKVLKPGAPPAEAIASGAQLAFMRLVLPKTNIFVGETVVAQLEIYLRDVIRGAGGFQITSFPGDGLTIRNGTQQGQEKRVQIGNFVYRLVPWPVAITAVKAGTTEIGPVTASLVITLPNNNRRRDSLFEQFGFRDPFNDGEQKQVLLTAEAVPTHLMALPKDNVPATFNGAVGDYNMTVAAGPTSLAVGDPITVRVQITGRGSMDSLTLPEQANWDGFKIYQANAKPAETSDQFGLQGRKEFEQIVVPQSTEVRELPAFVFSFFDPEAKRYRTLTHPATPLTVRPGGTAVVPASVAAAQPSQPAPPPQDIVPIKQRLGTMAQISAPLVTRPWFLAAQSVPALAFLAAFIWRKRTDSLANNPRLRRKRQVEQIIRDGTNDLRRMAAENNSDAFFATLFRLLQEQLGERLDCPATSITESVVDEKLRPRGVAESTLTALHELFQFCNQARYAPMKSSHELAEVVSKFERVVKELREVQA